MLAFVLAKKYKQTELNTISAILAQNYGEGVRYAASGLTIFALSIVCVALYASGGAVLAAVLDINKSLAIVLVGVVTVLYVSLGGIGSIFATQYVIQALVSSDDDKTAKRACLYVSGLMIPFGIATAMIGMCSALLHPGIKSIDALPVLITHMPTLAASLVVIGLAGALFGASWREHSPRRRW